MNTPIVPNELNTAFSRNAQKKLLDQFGREKRKLRISLTDRCNFKCRYCMPDHPVWLSKTDILTFAEIYAFSRIMVEMGIRHIRLTGGEPLMRADVVTLVAELNQLKMIGLERLSMTSNAYYLKNYAQALKQAGLDDINISLDSINPDIFQQMTKKPIQPVLEGIDAALAAGLTVKINCVLLLGQNDHGIVELTQWAYQKGISLRFIEYMPLDQTERWDRNQVMTEHDIITRLSTYFSIEKQLRTQEPATIYQLNGHFQLGIISTISQPFCQNCDRLRLTAVGELFTCLFSNQGVHVRSYIQKNQWPDLKKLIEKTVWNKEAVYIQHQQAPVRKISMHAIGG